MIILNNKIKYTHKYLNIVVTHYLPSHALVVHTSLEISRLKVNNRVSFTFAGYSKSFWKHGCVLCATFFAQKNLQNIVKMKSIVWQMTPVFIILILNISQKHVFSNHVLYS